MFGAKTYMAYVYIYKIREQKHELDNVSPHNFHLNYKAKWLNIQFTL